MAVVAVSSARIPGLFSVLDYGARGDGSHDDSTPFQNALTDAIAHAGTLVIPPPQPGAYYLLTQTVLGQPAQGAQTYVNIDAAGAFNAIRWGGASNTAMFRMLGWKHSWVRGVKVNLDAGSQTGVVVWDCDVTAAYPSTSHVAFESCFNGLWAGAGNVGWRTGHTSGGLADLSSYSWNNCKVNGGTDGATPVAGQIAWLDEASNGLVCTWRNCYWTAMAKGYSNVLTAGAGSPTGHGDDAKTFYNCGGTDNTLDFEFDAPHKYLISGGRWETGARLVQTPSASFAQEIQLSGVEVQSYGPNDGSGVLFLIQTPGGLTLDDCVIDHSVSDYTAAMITLASPSQDGTLDIRGGSYRAADPFSTVTSGTWKTYRRGAKRLDAAGHPSAYYVDI